MRRIVILLALALGACSSTSAANIEAAIDKFKTDVAGFEAGVQGVVASLNSGVAAAGQDLKMVCGGISVMNGLFQTVAPLAGASAGDKSDEALAMAGANALCAAPPPTDLASALASALATYKQIKSAVAAQAPQAVAGS
jgi:hypothetical protein